MYNSLLVSISTYANALGWIPLFLAFIYVPALIGAVFVSLIIVSIIDVLVKNNKIKLKKEYIPSLKMIKGISVFVLIILPIFFVFSDMLTEAVPKLIVSFIMSIYFTSIHIINTINSGKSIK